MKRHQNKRRRHLGFIPLNISFENSEAHHIDRDLVIFIPTELHRSIGHNVFSGKGMKEINALAFQWIATQENFEGFKEIGGKKYENHTDEDGQKQDH